MAPGAFAIVIRQIPHDAIFDLVLGAKVLHLEQNQR